LAFGKRLALFFVHRGLVVLHTRLSLYRYMVLLILTASNSKSRSEHGRPA